MNCIVTKLKAVIDNPDLPIFGKVVTPIGSLGDYSFFKFGAPFRCYGNGNQYTGKLQKVTVCCDAGVSYMVYILDDSTKIATKVGKITNTGQSKAFISLNVNNIEMNNAYIGIVSSDDNKVPYTSKEIEGILPTIYADSKNDVSFYNEDDSIIPFTSITTSGYTIGIQVEYSVVE